MCIGIGLSPAIRQHFFCHLNRQEAGDLAETFKFNGIQGNSIRDAIVQIKQKHGHQEFLNFATRVELTIKDGKKVPSKTKHLNLIMDEIKTYKTELATAKKQRKLEIRMQRISSAELSDTVISNPGVATPDQQNQDEDIFADPAEIRAQLAASGATSASSSIMDGFKFVGNPRPLSDAENTILERAFAEKREEFVGKSTDNIASLLKDTTEHPKKVVNYKLVDGRFSNINPRSHTLLKNVVKTDDRIYKKALERMSANLMLAPDKSVLGIATQYPYHERDSMRTYFRGLIGLHPAAVTVLSSDKEIVPTKRMNKYFKEGSLDIGDGVMTSSSLMKTLTFGKLTIEQYQFTMTDNKNGTEFTLPILHCTNWPDHAGANPEDLIEFARYKSHLEKTRKVALKSEYGEQSKHPEQHQGVTHCQAGVGRTGTLIGVQSLLEFPEDVAFETMVSLRMSRSHQVIQSEDQARSFVRAAMLLGHKVYKTDESKMAMPTYKDNRPVPTMVVHIEEAEPEPELKPEKKPKINFFGRRS